MGSTTSTRCTIITGGFGFGTYDSKLTGNAVTTEVPIQEQVQQPPVNHQPLQPSENIDPSTNPSITNNGYFEEDVERYAGTSYYAFNILFIDFNNVVRVRQIRGHDTHTPHFYRNLYYFLNKKSIDDLNKLEAFMRSENLITMGENGVLECNPVTDPNIFELSTMHNIPATIYEMNMNALESNVFGWDEDSEPTGDDGIEILENIVYRADSKTFYYTRHLTDDEDMTQEYYKEGFLLPIVYLLKIAISHIDEFYDITQLDGVPPTPEHVELTQGRFYQKHFWKESDDYETEYDEEAQVEYTTIPQTDIDGTEFDPTDLTEIGWTPEEIAELEHNHRVNSFYNDYSNSPFIDNIDDLVYTEDGTHIDDWDDDDDDF